MSGIKFCTHKLTIDDYCTGDTICEQCGLILEERSCFSDAPQKVQTNTLMPDGTHAVDKYHMMLIDFTFNACLPSKLALAAYDLYKKNRKERKLTLISNNTKVTV